MNQTEINNIELAPIGVTNTDVLSIYERVLNRTKAALNCFARRPSRGGHHFSACDVVCYWSSALQSC